MAMIDFYSLSIEINKYTNRILGAMKSNICFIVSMVIAGGTKRMKERMHKRI